MLDEKLVEELQGLLNKNLGIKTEYQTGLDLANFFVQITELLIKNGGINEPELEN